MGVGVSFNYIKELLELTWFYIFGFMKWEGYKVEKYILRVTPVKKNELTYTGQPSVVWTANSVKQAVGTLS